MREVKLFRSLFLRYLIKENIFDNFLNLLIKGKITEDFFDVKTEYWEKILTTQSFVFYNRRYRRILDCEPYDTIWEQKVTDMRAFLNRKFKSPSKEITVKTLQKNNNKYYNKFNNLKSKNYVRNNFRSCRGLSRR